MFSMQPLDKPREYTYHFLRRMKRYNCSITANFEFDVTEAMERIDAMRESGEAISFMAYFTKATALTMRDHPKLNERLFHTLWGKRVVTYDHIHCGILVERDDPRGHQVLIPLLIPHAADCSPQEIYAAIKKAKTGPLESIEAYEKIRKLEKLPRWVTPLIQFLFRTKPKLTAGKVSTYGISSLAARNASGVSGHAPSFQTTFFPVNIADRAWLYEGEIKVRTILHMTLSVDHYLIDGMVGFRAMETLRRYLENPSMILD